MMVRLPSGVQGNWRVMIDTGVGERPGRLGNEARPVFDALVGKLRIPSTRPGSAAIGEQGRPRLQAPSPGSRASPACPQLPRTRTKDL